MKGNGFSIRCPYCDERLTAICARSTDYAEARQCPRCDSWFVVAFDVEVAIRTLRVEGESDRAAERIDELLELERSRNESEPARGSRAPLGHGLGSKDPSQTPAVEPWGLVQP